MCGIAGLYYPATQRPVEPARIRAMTDAMAVRGPDGSGVWFAPGVAFGHRRLSVIDVAGSPQPMESADGELAAVIASVHTAPTPHSGLTVDLGRDGLNIGADGEYGSGLQVDADQDGLNVGAQRGQVGDDVGSSFDKRVLGLLHGLLGEDDSDGEYIVHTVVYPPS